MCNGILDRPSAGRGEPAQSASHEASTDVGRTDHDLRLRGGPKETRRGRAPAAEQIERIAGHTKRSTEEDKNLRRAGHELLEASDGARVELRDAGLGDAELGAQVLELHSAEVMRR